MNALKFETLQETSTVPMNVMNEQCITQATLPSLENATSLVIGHQPQQQQNDTINHCQSLKRRNRSFNAQQPSPIKRRRVELTSESSNVISTVSKSSSEDIVIADLIQAKRPLQKPCSGTPPSPLVVFTLTKTDKVNTTEDSHRESGSDHSEYDENDDEYDAENNTTASSHMESDSEYEENDDEYDVDNDKHTGPHPIRIPSKDLRWVFNLPKTPKWYDQMTKISKIRSAEDIKLVSDATELEQCNLQLSMKFYNGKALNREWSKMCQTITTLKEKAPKSRRKMIDDLSLNQKKDICTLFFVSIKGEGSRNKKVYSYVLDNLFDELYQNGAKNFLNNRLKKYLVQLQSK